MVYVGTVVGHLTALDAKSGVDRHELREAAQQQAAAYEQYDGDRELRRHERSENPPFFT